MIDDIITIKRQDILDLIVSADTYGFNDDVLMTSFATWLDNLHDSEIAEFASRLSAAEGYGEEDGEAATERLTDFKRKYESSGQLKS